MSIRLWVPGTIPPGLIERAVEAAWPGAHTVTAPAGPPLPPEAVTAGGTLRLARPEILPLSTGHDPEAPLRALAGAAAGLADGEHAVLQVLARPVTGARLRKARRAARKQRSGQSARMTSRLLDLASPGHGTSRTRAAGRADPELAAEIRETTAKLAGPQWETLIRYAVATTAPVQARDGACRWERRAAAAQQAARLRGLAHALASCHRPAHRAELARPPPPSPPRRRDRLPPAGRRATCCRCRNWRRSPGCPPTRRCPGLARAGARAVPPPPAIPLPGPGVRPLGVSDAGAPRPVGLAVPDARHHLRICGPTGTGKTTLIAGQILADADAGRGVVFIDPKGDAVTDVIARLPEESAGKVVLFDPGDVRHAAAVPERAARRRVRHRHRHDRGQRHRDLPADLRRVLGTQDRRHLPRRVPDPARLGAPGVRAGHPRRHPPAARRRRHPQAPHLRGPRPGAEGLLGLVRGNVPRLPGGGGRPADEQAPRVPAPQVRARRDRRRPVHLRHGRGPRQRRAVPGPAAQGHPRRGDRAARRVVHRRPDLAGRRPPRPAARARPPGRRPVHRRVPELPEPALPAGRHARRGPRLPARRHHGAPEPRPAPPGPAPGHLGERPLPGHLLRQPRGRPGPGAPHRPGAGRPRPVPPGRLPGRRPAGRRSAETPAFTFRTRPLPPPVPGRARLVRKAARAAHSATPGTPGTAPPPKAAGADPRLRRRT